MPDSTTATPATPAAPTAAERGHKKERVGEVVSAKMAKTIVVRVQRRFPHPKFKKVVTQFNKFYAHDEKSGRHSWMRTRSPGLASLFSSCA